MSSTSTSSSGSGRYDVPLETLHEADIKLLQQNPSLQTSCTKEERLRFILGLGLDKLNTVEKDLLKYIHFRENDLKDHREHLESLTETKSDGNADGNADGNTDTANNGEEGKANIQNKGQQMMFSKDFLRSIEITEETTNIDNTKIVYILPAAFKKSDMDIPIYKDKMTYGKYLALTIACYLDYTLGRDTYERFTIIVDTRCGSGENFGNLGVYSLKPIMKETVKILQSYFQERLKRFVMFPVPTAVMYAWGVVKLFIDKDSLSRYVLLKSKSDIDSDPPEDFKEFMEEEVMNRLETRRRDMFS